MEKCALSSDDRCKDDRINILLVTANVGTLFEYPDDLLEQWLLVLLKKVSQVSPQLFALHLQEVGGKTYETSMKYVHQFIEKLCEELKLKQFQYVRIYVDENCKSAENFTALGNMYFLHNSLASIRIWNFSAYSWETVKDSRIYSGTIDAVSTKEKTKFPLNFFPEGKWSRKGYMRTRWEINNTVFDLVNIHLFHDASNFAACEEFPSTYCKFRRQALIHTLHKFYIDKNNGYVPFFIFGDFNFRCDTEGVIAELTKNLTTRREHLVKDDCTKIYYRNSMQENVFVLGQKEFNHINHQLEFRQSWLKNFDRDLDPLKKFLKEFTIEFPPSYPYEESNEKPLHFMPTRCPSWCDRILMSLHAAHIIEDNSPNVYNIMGKNVCMGDHKPIYLNIHLKSHQGIMPDISGNCKNHQIFNDSCNDALCSKKNTSVDTVLTRECHPVRSRYIMILPIRTARTNERDNTAEKAQGDKYNGITEICADYRQIRKIFKETCL